MKKENGIKTKAALQIKLTLFVTSAVLIVSFTVLAFMGQLIRKDYEALMEERISDDLSAITQDIEQRVRRIEDAAETAVSIASTFLDSRSGIDTILSHAIKNMDDVLDMAMIFEKGFIGGSDGFYERIAHYGPGGAIQLDSYVPGDEVEASLYWQECYGQGKSEWSLPVKDQAFGQDIICFVTPISDTKGKRVGITYVSVPLSYLTSYVTQHKIRNDIDISIYDSEGTLIVAPDQYIMELSPKDLISQEHFLEHPGWKFVLSADKRIIDKSVREGLLTMAILIILMFVAVTLAIIVTIRYVVRPFVDRQRLTEQEKAVMDNELRLAASAQNELIPHVFPPFPQRKGIDIFACLHPARDVGGDLYDYFIHDGKLYFCIGDVSGKGLQASLFMSATHYLFRSVSTDMPVADTVKHMNISLCSDNELCRFVTFWFGCLNLSNGALEFVNAGHDAPVLIRNGKAIPFQTPGNMPLGAWEEAVFTPDFAVLQPGDLLLLYTDGVTESMNASGQEFGRKKLFDTVGSLHSPSASDIIQEVLTKVGDHASGAVQSDDITMLCVRFIKPES